MKKEGWREVRREVDWGHLLLSGNVLPSTVESSPSISDNANENALEPISKYFRTLD